MNLIRFDDPSTWEADLASELGDSLEARRPELSRHQEYMEDALDCLLADAPAEIIRATLRWIERNEIAAYHGTRLTQSELESIKARGLLPLDAATRAERLSRALRSHPRWESVRTSLIATIDRGAAGIGIGNRSGQAHLTLSRSSLSSGFTHYLEFGSEFDFHIAYQLLRDEGTALLARDGLAYILEFSIPGRLALKAANKYFSPEERIERGEVPSLAAEFLKTLGYRVSNPSFAPTQHRTDCGLVFKEHVPPAWLRAAEPWSK